MECSVTTRQVVFLLLSLLCFVNLPKRLGGSGIMKVCGFHCYATIFNCQLLNAYKTLLQAIPLQYRFHAANQKSSLWLDSISKSFYYTNLGNYNAPIKVLPHLPPYRQCGGICRGVIFLVKSPTFPLLQCGV